MEVRPLRSLRELPEALGPPAQGRLGLELDVLPAAATSASRDLLDGAELVDAAPALMDVRSRKSEWEVGRVRAAAGRSRGAAARRARSCAWG